MNNDLQRGKCSTLSHNYFIENEKNISEIKKEQMSGDNMRCCARNTYV